MYANALAAKNTHTIKCFNCVLVMLHSTATEKLLYFAQSRVISLGGIAAAITLSCHMFSMDFFFSK